jgi:hypothetical protein
VTVTVSRPDTFSNAPSGWEVAVQLGKVEGRRILLHPASLFTLLLAVGAMWVMHQGEAPVLNRASATTVVPLMVFAAGVLIASADASARLWTTEQSEALDIAPASPRVRTAGLVLAATAPVIVGLILQVVTIAVLLLNDPVTSLVPWDFLAGITVIALSVAIGVAAGRWIPSRFTGPMTLIALIAAVSYLGSYGMRSRFGDVVTWFAPFVALDWEPAEIVFRPTGAHLIYLIGLVGVFIGLALLRGTGRRWFVGASLVASVAVLAAGVGGQLADYEAFDSETVLAEYMPPLAEDVCQVRGNVEYCALAGYENWIEEWAEMVEGVLDVAPDNIASTQLAVRQYPTRLMDQGQSFTLEYEPGIAVGAWWNRGGGGKTQADAYPFGLALGVSSWAVGIPFERTPGRWVWEVDDAGNRINSEFVPGIEGVPEDEIEYAPYCSTLNQGRAMVALWMAAQVDQRTGEYLANRLERTQAPLVEEFVDTDGTTFPMFHGMLEEIDNGQYYPWYPILYWMHEAYYAQELLEQDPADVEALVAQHWQTLTDPTTTTAEAVQLLGIDPVPGLSEWMATFRDTFYEPCA